MNVSNTTRVLALLLFMLVCSIGTIALAGPNPGFSAATSGPITRTTITGTISVADPHVGQTGAIYVVAQVNGQFFAYDGSSWLLWDGVTFAAYTQGPLQNTTLDVVRDADLSGLPGTLLYLGYGLSQAEMLAQTRYALVYSVPYPPTVTDTNIVNGATGVALNSTVSAAFSRAMDPATLNSGTFTLRLGTTAVPGTVSYSGLSARFTPDLLLLPNTTYTATLTTGVKDPLEYPLAAPYIWSFTTGSTIDMTPPTVASTTIVDGATNIAVQTQIGATFSEAMDLQTLNSTTFTLKQGSTPISGSVHTSTGAGVTFTPDSPLSSNTSYTATLSIGVKDAAGNALISDYSWTWITSP